MRLRIVTQAPQINRCSCLLSRCVFLIGCAALLVGCATARPSSDSPVTAKDFYLKGFQYLGRNEHDKAIVEFTRAIAQDPNYADAYIARNFSYRMIDKHEEAVADMSEAIRLQPKIASYYSLRAQYMGVDNLDRALADYDTVLTLVPDDYSVYWAKAELLFKAGRYADAISEYREFLQKAPSTAGVVTKAALATIISGGLLDPMGTGKEARSSAKAVIGIRHRATERIQLCEALLNPISPTETPRSITNGMSKNDVLQIVLLTDRIVGEELQGATHSGEEFLGDAIVTCSRTGSFEDRTIRVFVFKDDRLILEKSSLLNDVLPAPGVSTMAGPINLLGASRDTVLQSVRTTDTVIYNDEKRIIAVTEWAKHVKGKGVRMFLFSKNKLVTHYVSGRLW
jgi:Flp pilus assembly protein TadD